MTRWGLNRLVAIGIGGLVSLAGPVGAAEHGGTTKAPAAKEHGGGPAAPAASLDTTRDAALSEVERAAQAGTTQEHGGQAVKAEPSAEQIRQTIQSYVQGTVQKKGAFPIKDPVAGSTRNLEFVRVHDRVGKTGSLYYSCTDMRDTQTGELLDLDFDVQAEDGKLSVVDQRIHKVNGQARYTYDEHDNRIPLSPSSG